MCLGFMLRRIKKWQTEEMKKGKNQAEMQMSATEKEKTLREIEGNSENKVWASLLTKYA